MTNQELHTKKQHHIDMVKGDIAKTVLVPSDPEGVEVFASLMDQAEKIARKREYLTYTGEKDGSLISCTSSGIGSSPTAIGTEELIRLDAQNIIRIGTCMSIQPFIEPGDMIIPLGAVRDERATEEFIHKDYPAITDFRIVRALIDACEKLGLTYHLGIIRTHDAFYLESSFSQVDYKAKIQKWIDLDVLALDNESSALFVIASMQGVRAGALLLSGFPIHDKENPDFVKHEKNLVQAGIEAAKILQNNGSVERKSRNGR